MTLTGREGAVGSPAGLRPLGEVDELAAATLRFLAVDAIEEAGSGHPGLPLGAALPAWVLWSRHLRHDPADAGWPDRDRFVLSAGHGSALLYALLHLTGHDLDVADLRRFRRLGSRTPGHPEYGVTPGVETTTGPLGQGMATAVGMALAERMLAQRCNTPEHPVVDHRTWALVGDGCLMEGISHEAASLAGMLRLDRLTVVFDDNDVTIDGPARRSCTDDVEMRFRSYGWHTVRVEDGTDAGELDRAYAAARAETDRPTFVAVRTTIGLGAPGVEGTPSAHGSPIGAEAAAAMRDRAGWPASPFHVPDAVRGAVRERQEAWATSRRVWDVVHDAWRSAHPERAASFPLRGTPVATDLTELRRLADRVGPDDRTATRRASARALRALADACPGLVGGSADLAASTGATLDGDDVGPGSFAGRTVPFGVREHGMAAALNGLALHGGLRPFGSTFLVFSDYLRPALRLSALMGLPVTYVFTHDSVHVGEDGPTHQPVEHLESLRSIPGLTVLRPADTAETALAWELAATATDRPTVLVLSRQDLPEFGTRGLDQAREHGFRTVGPDPVRPDVVLAASGSEVGLVCKAGELLRARGAAVRVLSVPWRERFEHAWRTGTVPAPDAPVVWVEAGIRTGWRALARPADAVLGIDGFGHSGGGVDVAVHMGLSVREVAAAAFRAIGRGAAGR
ncbi:transketolase [Pseudonocardia endophytica]|uniref:Transketolase n=1 Tax=Pseudonocardia endophytica TaxID=401976 RepID=A0A4R1IA75_PSEEN|nr:transketolase [Pseudonocardia endophytica]TCK27222.1 transketolase [Pseudonocardia endophytica]